MWKNRKTTKTTVALEIYIIINEKEGQ